MKHQKNIFGRVLLSKKKQKKKEKNAPPQAHRFKIFSIGRTDLKIFLGGLEHICSSQQHFCNKCCNISWETDKLKKKLPKKTPFSRHLRSKALLMFQSMGRKKIFGWKEFW